MGRLRHLSLERWPRREPLTFIGRDPSILKAQEKLVRFAEADAPVLLTGETGTGKELFARAIYLLSRRRSARLVLVNCARFRDSDLITSELFGHRRGSFTGAVRDHPGLFREADGGTIFLDEIAELSHAAQAMLLRVISEGEVTPVGGTEPDLVDIRVVAATNKELRRLVAAGEFRRDLYFRLSFFQLHLPPLRDRGDDWRLLLDYYRRRVDERRDRKIRFSEPSLRMLGRHTWPGNVRELKSMVEMSHFLCDDGGVIRPGLLAERLAAHPGEPVRPISPRTAGAPRATAPDGGRKDLDVPPGFAGDLLRRIAAGEGGFWELVHRPFMDRDLNRREVRQIVEEGLRRNRWSYKEALRDFGVEEDQYLKFMDFLRHHRLKPDR